MNIPTVAIGAPTTSGNVTVEQVPDTGLTPNPQGSTDEALKQQLISDLNSGKISLSEYNKEMEEFGFQKPTTLISAGAPTTSPSGPNTALYNLLTGGTGGASLGAPNNFYTPLAFSQDGRVSSFQVPGSGEVYSVLKYNLDGTATTAPQSRPEEITQIYLDSVTGTVTPIKPPETEAPVAPTPEPTEEEKKAEEVVTPVIDQEKLKEESKREERKGNSPLKKSKDDSKLFPEERF
jgi:outer membrane biosynthesis protein TonB